VNFKRGSLVANFQSPCWRASRCETPVRSRRRPVRGAVIAALFAGRYADESTAPTRRLAVRDAVSRAAGAGLFTADAHGARCRLHDVDLGRSDVCQELLQGRAVERGAREGAVVIAGRDQAPAFVRLALDIGLAGLALGTKAELEMPMALLNRSMAVLLPADASESVPIAVEAKAVLVLKPTEGTGRARA
jgi:hypothetical protein